MTRECAWLQHTPLVPVLVALLQPRTFVELGTHNGDSYCAFCEAALRLNTGTQCAAVDTWTGDPHAGAYGPEILAGLRDFHDRRYSGFSRLMQMTFDEALTHFPDDCIDLLHIDGLHTYAAVKHDLDSWRPKLTDRAVVLFHDTAARLPGFGVWQLWDQIAPTAPSFNFPYGWGLGLLALGTNVPAPFLDLLEQLRTDPNLLSLLSALGQRNELLRNISAAGDALRACHDITNQWRRLAGLPARNTTVDLQQAIHFPAAVGPMVVADLLQTANDAFTLQPPPDAHGNTSASPRHGPVAALNITANAPPQRPAPNAATP
jgi:hypothetical protein